MVGDADSISRRALLAGLASTSGIVSGCLSNGDATEPVSMLVAGSLHNATENALKSRVETEIHVEARGSTELARQVAAGQKDPDIVAVADDALFESPLDTDWHAQFATNAVVLAYNPETDGGRQLAETAREAWYRPLLDGSVTLGRTDPDLDPLGYRTLFALELATGYYDTDVDLRDSIPAPEQVYPETQLISQLETGSIDAAFAYRSMAVERGYEYITLPPAIDLSDPKHADSYATATYELPDGTVVNADLIRYGATIRRRSDTVQSVFETQTSGEYLEPFGFSIPDGYPRFTDDAPKHLAE